MKRMLYDRVRYEQMRTTVRMLPAILSGREPDRMSIGEGFRTRLAMAWFSKVKQAFIVKSRGGTDDAGISWPKLSKKYLAYGRRFGRGEQAKLKRAAGLGRANRFAPGGKEGLLTAAQLKQWRQIYARSLAWLAARHPIDTAKGIAAGIAWNRMKALGAKTKLEVYGNREVEILRDTGILFNSLSPGVVNGTSYSPAEGQVVRHSPGELVCGTNVAYAGAHHRGKRPLWPSTLPESWKSDLQDTAERGLSRAIRLMAEAS